MSYEYAGCLYNTARQAARASVSDYLYAGGNNSTETVAEMNIAEIAAELEDLVRRGEWSVEECNQSVAEMVREIICEAGEEISAATNEEDAE